MVTASRLKSRWRISIAGVAPVSRPQAAAKAPASAAVPITPPASGQRSASASASGSTAEAGIDERAMLKGGVRMAAPTTAPSRSSAAA